MFRNLRAEMAREGVNGIQVAEKIGICDKAFRNKMNGTVEFTRLEMKRIKSLFPKELTYEYLFDLDGTDLKTA